MLIGWKSIWDNLIKVSTQDCSDENCKNSSQHNEKRDHPATVFCKVPKSFHKRQPGCPKSARQVRHVCRTTLFVKLSQRAGRGGVVRRRGVATARIEPYT